MIGEATYIACRHKQQLLPSTKQELPSWIYVRGKVQFKSMCCLEGIECGPQSDSAPYYSHTTPAPASSTYDNLSDQDPSFHVAADLDPDPDPAPIKVMRICHSSVLNLYSSRILTMMRIWLRI
jgi:hypothetical protein